MTCTERLDYSWLLLESAGALIHDFRVYLYIKYPQGDLNPCLQAENLTSWATRRWGLRKNRYYIQIKVFYDLLQNSRIKKYYIYPAMSMKFHLFMDNPFAGLCNFHFSEIFHYA